MNAFPTVKISAILPVYSEIETVKEIVQRLEALLADELHEVLIVIAPRSLPASWAMCEELSRQYPYVKLHTQQECPGVGRAFREGFRHATGTHILMLDSDGEMDVESVPAMLAEMKRTRCQVVLGSRWMRGGGVEGYDNVKYFLNRGYQYLFRALFCTRLHDLTFGFKLMDAAVGKTLPWISVFGEIGAETTLRPLTRGYKIGEVPTVWKKRKHGESKNRFSRNFRYVGMALELLFKGK